MMTWLKQLFCRHDWRTSYSEGWIQEDGSNKGLDDCHCPKCGAEKIFYFHDPAPPAVAAVDTIPIPNKLHPNENSIP